MKKVELLAPAGDLEKLKIAVMHGADAVFIGGEEFSLRSRASNFTISDIKEACEFAHSHNAKVHVTTNIIPHNENMDGLISYLKSLEEAGVDALICASPYIIETALANTNIDVHISTQQSTSNIEAIKFWESRGAKRVVLSREVSLDEMKEIMDKTNIEIEAFIHGGMCVSYSGRCMLSNEMTNRDANRGGCAHSCRWNYDLYCGDSKINDDEYFSMSSKDLQSLRLIPKLIDLGVDSFKIEGRMKSIHYIATVVSCYRKVIDKYLSNEEIDFDYFEKEIKKAENRLTSTGFLNGEPSVSEQLYNSRSEQPTQEFVGIVLDYNNGLAKVEVRNFFTSKNKLEVFGPKLDSKEFMIDVILDENNNVLDVARHPKSIVYIKIPFEVSYLDMIRIKE